MCPLSLPLHVSLSLAIPSPIQGPIPRLAPGCVLFGSRWFDAGTKAGPRGSFVF